MERLDVLATDLDRTLTGPDLVPDRRALAALQDLRGRGVRVVLATGRGRGELERHPALAASFDAYVLEGGAVWGAWGRLASAETGGLWECADRLEAGGVAVQRRSASFSVPRTAEPALAPWRDRVAAQANRDRVDVAPRGHDKGTGLAQVLRRWPGVDGRRVAAIGDGENDAPLLLAAGVRVAVANAAPELLRLAGCVTRGAGPEGVLEFLAESAPAAPSGAGRGA